MKRNILKKLFIFIKLIKIFLHQRDGTFLSNICSEMNVQQCIQINLEDKIQFIQGMKY